MYIYWKINVLQTLNDLKNGFDLILFRLKQLYKHKILTLCLMILKNIKFNFH
jgi:hypothetical protein